MRSIMAFYTECKETVDEKVEDNPAYAFWPFTRIFVILSREAGRGESMLCPLFRKWITCKWRNLRYQVTMSIRQGGTEDYIYFPPPAALRAAGGGCVVGVPDPALPPVVQG